MPVRFKNIVSLANGVPLGEILSFSPLQLMTPSEAQKLALQVAYEGWGQVAPNPLVGCVIVDKQHRFLAAGAHRRYGEDHAEINALRQVSDARRIEGAWVYVTLEPCAHQGRTPSCAAHLAQLPIAGVTYMVQDPHPLVNGGGVEILRQSGKKVIHGTDWQEAAESLAEIFLTNLRKKRPFVALKVATTVDGVMALRGHGNLWLTGPEAGEHVHFLRAGYDAIVVGKNTLMMDDPQLNIRHSLFPNQRNNLVVLDSRADAYREDLKIFADRTPDEVFWVLSEALADGRTLSRAQTLVSSANGQGELDLEPLLCELYDRGIRSLFLEGGSQVYGAFLSQGWVDRLYILTCPQLGMGSAQEAIYWTQSVKTPGPIKLQNINQMPLGVDWLTTGRITPLGE